MPDLNISSKFFSKLGIIKTELLIFSLLAFIALNAAALPLESQDRFTCRTMQFSSVLIILLAFGFYIYAIFNLAPSTQAFVFAQDGKKMIREHRARRPKLERPENPEGTDNPEKPDA